MAHPCGIEPWGNFYFRNGAGPNIRDAGLGSLHVLSDALVLELLGLLGARDLGRLALASRAAYCFTNLEDLWKGLVIEEFGGRFTWAGCWQRTYLVTSGRVPPEEQGQEPESDDEEQQQQEQEEKQREEKQQKESREQAEEQEGAGGRRKGRAKGAARSRGKAAGEEAPAAPRGKRQKTAAATAAAAAGEATNGNCAAANGKRAGTAAASSSPAPPHANGSTDGGAAAAPPRRLMRRVPGCGPQRYLPCPGMYSDLLYQPWHCATLEPQPEWFELDNIDRRRDLTPEEFRAQYEVPNRPVILQGVMDAWPGMRKWSTDYFRQLLGDKEVTVGNMPMPFSTYAAYCAANRDEMPLYLFDPKFSDESRSPSLEADYSVPEHFGEDLFGLLGAQARPEYRWLILGPARSGSSFHVDPNATSAWNALLWGAKKWVMYPPGVVPPGVHPSPDGADVATPVSLTEWFVNFYAATRETKVRPVEFVARPGDLLFVPRGWWHCALNLEESCALTQNFVSEVGLPQVLTFLRSRRPELVSGCAHESRCDLYDRFLAALRQHRPHVLAALEVRQEEARRRAEKSHQLASLFKHPEPGAQGKGAAGPAKVQAGGGVGCKAEAGAGTGTGGEAVSNGTACGGAGGGSTAGGGGASGGFSFGFALAGAGSGAPGAAAPAAAAGTGAGSGSGGTFKFGFSL